MTGSILSFRFFLYLIYGAVLTAVLLYVRFPTEKVRTYCEHRIEDVLREGRASIVKIVYHFPATVEFRKVKIGSQAADGKRNEIIIDRLRLFPTPKGFLTSWAVDGELYTGMFKAKLEIQLEERIFQLKDIALEKADIAAVTADMSAIQREVTGSLTVSGEYKAKFDQPLTGFGSGSLHLSAGSLHLVRQILTLDVIDFDAINVLWKYGESVVQITEGKMIGRQLDADFSGTLKPPFLPLEGDVNVSGLLVPGERFLKDRPQIERLVQRLMKQYKKPAVPFRVGGTFDKPLFRLSV